MHDLLTDSDMITRGDLMPRLKRSKSMIQSACKFSDRGSFMVHIWPILWKTVVCFTVLFWVLIPLSKVTDSQELSGEESAPAFNQRQAAAAHLIKIAASTVSTTRNPHYPSDKPAVRMDSQRAKHSTVKLPAAAVQSDKSTTTTGLPASVEGLIQDIRAAAMRVNGGKAVKPLSRAAKKKWHKRNPCTSREKLPLVYSRRKSTKDADHDNAAWQAVFREYTILHRTCTSEIRNVTEYLQERITRTGCKFMVCDATEGSGLGNKMLLITSCFLYAVLTQRIFLVPSSSLLCDIMCEPFEGSSWRIPDGRVLGLGPSPNFFASVDSFLATRGDDLLLQQHSKNVSAKVDMYATDVSDDWFFQPENRFYCPTEQSFLSNVTCIGVVGCQYTIPKLFSMPTFRPTLESLFPTRMVLTDLLRSLMLPVDSIWHEVEKVEAMQPDRADRRVGVQIRYFRGVEAFEKLHQGVDSRIRQCFLENGILPKQKTKLSDDAIESPRSSKRITVFIASLHNSFEKSLTMEYLQNPPANGENVTIVQLSQKLSQGYSVQDDAQAMVEMILLSFSDDIIVTPMSTFGGVAHAYGALRPWFVQIPPWFVDNPDNVSEPDGPPCVRAQTIDTCSHLPEKQFDCPHDPELHGRFVTDLTPSLKDCLVEDVRTGIQLITSTRQSPSPPQHFLSSSFNQDLPC
jgi:xyloglucan fucosyltransferase